MFRGKNYRLLKKLAKKEPVIDSTVYYELSKKTDGLYEWFSVVADRTEYDPKETKTLIWKIYE